MARNPKPRRRKINRLFPKHKRKKLLKFWKYWRADTYHYTINWSKIKNILNYSEHLKF